MLEKSIASLRENAHRSDLVEVLVAIDPDDPETAGAEIGWPSQRLVTAERFGYSRLHEYYNWLASRARGEWLFLWNDDAIMRTPGWDRIIERQPPGVLWPQTNDQPGCNVFPVWPRQWFTTLGHVSLSPHCDSWVQDLGQALGVQRFIPVHVFHNHPRLSGTANDQTYADAQAGYRTEEFHSGPMAAARQADVEKLRAAIR